MSAKPSKFKVLRNQLRDLLIPPLLYKIIRNKKELRYQGLHGIDQKLEKYLNYDNGFFVELGANNGILQSNTFYFEKFRNWKGVLVEPVLHNFLQCKLNRPKSKAFCNACTPFNFPEKFVEIVYSNLMSVSKNLDLDIADPHQHVKDGLQFLSPEEENIAFGATAKPLNSILEEAQAPFQIDLLSLDVEGAELEVLRGVNHQLFRFKYCVVESRSIEKLSRFMTQHGYEFLENLSHHDYLFRDKKMLS